MGWGGGGVGGGRKLTLKGLEDNLVKVHPEDCLLCYLFHNMPIIMFDQTV